MQGGTNIIEGKIGNEICEPRKILSTNLEKKEKHFITE
jgi:hypothetical protein